MQILWIESSAPESEQAMKQGVLDELRYWFHDYVESFYGRNPRHNAHIHLKQNHTERVCAEMRLLCLALDIRGPRAILAQVIALLHDVGRFEQFARHGSFLDVRTENHCLLGLQVIRDNKLLAAFEPAERQVIETAIEHHGARDLPGDLPPETDLYARLIRDADKLDIYHVIIDNYHSWRSRPEGFLLEVPFTDTVRCSDHMIAAVREGRSVAYDELQTINDVKLLQIGWVYDINFWPSLQRLIDKGYIAELFRLLPDEEPLRDLRIQVLSYIQSRIQSRQNHAPIR